MFHIIEHFAPKDLLNFMDYYLDRLKKRGYLIIATPLNWSGFYNDFDHIKPYYPMGIEMVFQGNTSQVQYYLRNKIKLIDIWIRRAPFINVVNKRLYKDKNSYTHLLMNTISKALFKYSFGIIGRSNGWMGLYRKIK